MGVVHDCVSTTRRLPPDVVHACPDLANDATLALEDLGQIKVKGINHPISVYQITPLPPGRAAHTQFTPFASSRCLSVSYFLHVFTI